MSEFMDGSMPGGSLSSSSAAASLLAIHFDGNGTADAAVFISDVPYGNDSCSLFATGQPLLSDSNGNAADLAIAALSSSQSSPRDNYYGFNSVSALGSALGRILHQELAPEIANFSQLATGLQNLNQALSNAHSALGSQGQHMLQTPSLLQEAIFALLASEMGSEFEGQAEKLESGVRRALSRATGEEIGAASDASDLAELAQNIDSLPSDVRDKVKTLLMQALKRDLAKMDGADLLAFAGKIDSLPADMQAEIKDKLVDALTKMAADADPQSLISMLSKCDSLPDSMKSQVTDMLMQALEKKLEHMDATELMKLLGSCENLPPQMKSKVEELVLHALEKKMQKMGPEELEKVVDGLKNLPPQMQKKVEELIVVAFFHLLADVKSPEQLQRMGKILANAPPSLTDKLASAMAQAIEKMLKNLNPQQMMALLQSLGKMPPQLLAKIMPKIKDALEQAFSKLSPRQLEGMLAVAGNLPGELKEMVIALLAKALLKALKPETQKNGDVRPGGAKNLGQEHASKNQGSHRAPFVLAAEFTDNRGDRTDLLLVSR